MIYTGYELLCLFFVYSFAGWILETVTAAVRHKVFANRGLVNSPLCVLYGFSAVFITIFCGELKGFWLLAASTILSTTIEWTAGHLIERLYHEKWWDYSGIRWNLDGYICFRVSLLWGVLCVVMMKWGNPLLLGLYNSIPRLLGRIIIWGLTGLLLVDATATLIIMSGRSKRMQQWESIDLWLTGISSRLGRWVYGHVDRRIRKAYPAAQAKKPVQKDPAVFAGGCGFYKLVWLFVIGAVIGDLTEIVFCRLTMGRWMSRSSLVWGQFSIVWGFGIAGATLFLHRYRERSDRFLFAVGTCLGGVYEYVCSVFSELAFGTIFWDYSRIPFNLGGRINLLYCFFWGIAAVLWLRALYPKLSALIERIPVRPGKILTWLGVVFLSLNMAVSALAFYRSVERDEGIEAVYKWQQIMDERFDDARIERIYPSAKKVD